MSSLSGRAPCAMSPASNTALVSGISRSASVARRKTDRRPRRSRHNCQECVAGSFIARASDTGRQNDANRSEIRADSWFPRNIRPFSCALPPRPINPSNRRAVLAFSRQLDSSHAITSLRAAVSPQRNKITRPIITESGGGAVTDHSEAAPGDFYGGHRCRELCYAHCLFSCLHFSSRIAHSHTTPGSIAAASRTTPANGAAATTTARATRGRRPPPRAGWSKASLCHSTRPCRSLRRTASSRSAADLTEHGAAFSVSSPDCRINALGVPEPQLQPASIFVTRFVAVRAAANDNCNDRSGTHKDPGRADIVADHEIGNAGENERAEGNRQRPEAQPVDRVDRSLSARRHRFDAGFRGQMNSMRTSPTFVSPSLANAVPALM